MNLKKGKSWGAAVILAIVLLSSCKSLKNTNTLFLSEYDKFADTAKTVFVANAGSIEDNDYKIRPHDLVSVRNIQNPLGPNPPIEGAVKPTVFRLDENGDITLPVLGKTNILGLTQTQARMKIQELYGKTLIKDPIIELLVVNFKVTLLGSVNRPGNYIVEKENTNLIEIIGESGGLLSTSDAHKIKIIRGHLENPEIIYVNLKNLKTLGSKKLKLQNNDIIYVPRKGISTLNEGVTNYLNIVQPVLLVLNLVILFTIKR